MSDPIENMDVDGNSHTPPPSSTSPSSNTATKIVEQLKILIENRKEWATKIGNAELSLLNCDAVEEKGLENERDQLVINKGILDKKIQRLEETLKMMKNVMEAEVKPQDIPGEEETDTDSKKRKKKKKRVESDSESSSDDSESEDNRQLIIPKEAPRYYEGDNVKAFLDSFHVDMPSLLGPKKFDKLCKRYLIVLTKCKIIKKALMDEFETEGLEHPTWEQCEVIFMRVAMSEDDRTVQMMSAISSGRAAHETYKQFALRMLHDVNLYGIIDKNEMVVSLIRAGLNDEAKNNLANKLANKSKEKYTSVIELLKDIKTLSGPSLAKIAAIQQTSFGPKQIGPSNNNKRSNNQHNPNKKHKSNGYYGNNQPVVYQNNNPINGYQLQQLPAMLQQQQFQQQFQQQPFIQQYPQQQRNFMNQNGKLRGFKGQNKNQIRGNFSCSNCGHNRTHNTEQCISCGKCGKKGHFDKDCKGPNYQRNGGQGNPTLEQAHVNLSAANVPLSNANAISIPIHQNKALTTIKDSDPIASLLSSCSDFDSFQMDTLINTPDNHGQNKEPNMKYDPIAGEINITNNDTQFYPESENESGETCENTNKDITLEVNEPKLSCSSKKKNRSVRLRLRKRQIEATLKAMKKGMIPTPKQSALLAKFEKANKVSKSILDKQAYVSERNPLIASLYANEHIDLRAMYFDECERANKEERRNSPCNKNEPIISQLNTHDSIDPCVNVNLIFEGETYPALLDTGATHSCIHADVVKKHMKEIHPISGQITLADTKSTTARVGQTESLEVTYNDQVIFAPFEVLNNCSHPFLIGMDLFHKLGLSISGLENPGKDATLLPEPIEDTKPSIVSGEVPEEEKQPAFLKVRKLFLAAIQESLEKNGLISKSSACPLPEMKVYLPVRKGISIFRRPRQFPEKQQTIFDEAVAKWLKDEVITLAPAGNPHNNTLTLAGKKDKDGNKTLWRVCLDPRPLNKEIPDDNYPIPLISEILGKLSGNSIFSMIDLSQAYHRLPINEADQPLTAFMHNNKQYMFKRAPFGLKPLSSIFQRGMSRILGDLPFVLNFIDDIVIFSKNREEHAEHVRTVIARLTAARLIINLEKCFFFHTQISLLGFVVGLHGKSVDPKKLANIDSWCAPTTGKQVQSYLGTFNFFREYIPMYSTVAAPLDALRNHPGHFVLNKKQQVAFDTLKNLLARAPILSFADFSLPFYVATDASDVGVGAVLYQLPKGEKYPKVINYISFQARSLQERERRYSATKKELLGIVFALNKFHYYLWGRHFQLFTDHRALTFLHSQQNLNSMMTTWQDTILNYSFTINYRPGIINILPDALSRLFEPMLKLSRMNSNINNVSIASLNKHKSDGKNAEKCSTDHVNQIMDGEIGGNDGKIDGEIGGTGEIFLWSIDFAIFHTKCAIGQTKLVIGNTKCVMLCNQFRFFIHPIA